MIKGSLFLDSFRRAVELNPDREALIYKDTRFTYSELEDLTNRVAGWLRMNGIGSGSIVSVLIPRCEYMMIASLGILRSGAAYEPMDISFSKSRITSMIEEADSACVIVSKEYDSFLSEVTFGDERKKLYIEDIPSLPACTEKFWPELSKEDAFVILYTSGSTGTPKGIILTHGNIASLLHWCISYYEIDNNCHMGQYANYAFDMSVKELILPLAAGASVYIIPQEIRLDLIALKKFYDENNITHSTVTTQIGRQFALNIECKTLRHLMVGGEALVSVAPPKGYILHNEYGPSECTLFVTSHPVMRDYPGNVPLGRAIGDVEIYLLDENGDKVLDGEIGELCISGPHLAKGYLKNPELTNKSFTPNPFSDDPKYQRIYHTGDLARINEEGLFEYVGRKDRQIKIRGYRIEPAEIEALLNRYEGIDNALVTAAKIGGQKVLIAYYVSAKPIDKGLLSEYVLQNKPLFMCPSFYVHMKEFPLTAIGKIDMERLPLPEREADEGSYETPVTEIEKTLSALYAEILSVKRVGRQDDFYSLGGDSISATTLLLRVYQSFSCRINIRDIMENPVLKDLSKKIENALSAKEEPDCVIEPLAPASLYAVSNAQKRMYTVQELSEKDDPTYLLFMTLRTEGAFDEKRVQHVLKQLFVRHESLRTSFHMTDSGLVQKIEPAEDTWIKDAIDRARTDVLPRFVSMDDAPLFYWRFKRQEITFEWHHIISDGRSVVLFAREFVALYQGESLPEHSVHQKEYAAYERRLEASSIRDKSRAAFSEVLTGFTDTTEVSLPLDGSYKTGATRIAGHVKKVFSETISEQIGRFCSENAVTPYMLLLSGFSILLKRYSLQEKIILGTVMDGREHPEISDIQGMFVNTVPLFLQVSEDRALSAFLAEVSENVLSAMEHQSVPLEDIAADFESAGGYSRTAHGHLLFDILFVMQSLDTNLTDIDGKRVWAEFPAGDRAMYDLTLEVEKKEDGCYHLDFEYDKDLFLEESIEILAGHYENLIKSCLDAGDKSIYELSMVDEAEKERILTVFNPKDNGTNEEGKTDTVIDRLYGFVSKEPEKPAVIIEDRSLSYIDLWERSGELSEKILRMLPPDGSGNDEFLQEEHRILIFAKRSLSMIVSIWAVLRSGCTYVPVSYEYPKERMLYILGDSKPSCVILCGADLPESVLAELESNDIPVLEYYEEYTGSEILPVSKIQTELPAVRPDRAAYMIYTSGSTGKPKGVLVEHRQLASMLSAYTDIYNPTERDVVLQFASFVFDQSVLEIFHILTVGGTLCLIPDSMVKDPEALGVYCTERNVTMTGFTPGFLRLLKPEDFPSVRFLEVGGEAPDRSTLNRWIKNRVIFNTYGPTETTVNAASFKFSEGGIPTLPKGYTKENVPIGQAIKGTRIYILNGDELAGIGVPGEICIAGRQVTRGYFNKPALTEEKFTKDTVLNGRMYRSGDLARFLPDGNIEFMGRIDDQIKLHGYRIEIGEIEAAVKSAPGIRDAVCLIKRDDLGEKRLYGYFIPEKSGEKPTKEELRTYLEEKLPLYMVPQLLIELDELPLTINGKLDRKALPDADRSVENTYSEPVNEEEMYLVSAIKTVLGIKNVGTNEDFLAIGGDSIKAIQVSALLRKQNYIIDAGIFLQVRSIKKLAQKIKRQTSAENAVYREYDTVMFTPVMKLYEAAGLKNPAWYNQSEIFAIPNGADIPALTRAIYALIRFHGMLRAKLKGNGELTVREYSDVKLPALSVYKDLTQREREEVCTGLQAGMDPDKGIMMKCALFKNDDCDYLFLAFHHLIIDEVSWNILFKDLKSLYSYSLHHPQEQEVLAENAGLVKSTSFGEWSQKLWQYRDNEAFLPEKTYWEAVNKEVRSLRARGDDFLDQYRVPHSETLSGFGDIECAVEKSVSQKLSLLAVNRYHTGLDALLLAGLVDAAYELDGTDSLIIQRESHGRGKIDDTLNVDRTVGWFTAVYPVVLRHVPDNGGKHFDAQVSLIKEVLLSVPNFGIGYGLLYNDLTDFGGIVFNYLGIRNQNEKEKRRKEDILWSTEGSGSELFEENGDPCTISIDIRENNNRLDISCRYDRIFDENRIRRLLECFTEKLTEIAKIQSKERVYSPSDLGMALNIPPADWKRLLTSYDPAGISALARPMPLQQGMLYRHIAEPESKAYLLQDKLVIKGKWEPVHFEHALNLLHRRFDTLRSRFVYEGMSEPWLIILKEQETGLISVAGKTFEEAMAEEVRRGFDLSKEPLFKAIVPEQKEEEDDTEILICTHHLILDGWSFPIVVKELMRYYKLLKDGISMQRLVKDIQKEVLEGYSFAEYIKEYNSLNKERAFLYWKNYLDGAEEGLTLGLPDTANIREQVDGKETSVLSADFHLNGEEEKKIRDYTKKHHITCSVFFEVLWGIFLGFENRSTDIVFGETISGRHLAVNGIENTVGMLIQTIPVRIHFDAQTLTGELMEQRQREYRDGVDASCVSLSEIGEITGLGSKLIKCLFAYENYPDTESTEDYSFVPIHEETDYGVTISIEERDGFHILLGYSPSIFSSEYVKLLPERLHFLAEQIISGEESRVMSYERIPKSQFGYMLSDISGIKKEYEAKTFLGFLRTQVFNNPEKPALCFGERTLTYRELVTSAQNLADEIGYGEERFVAVMAERGFETVISLIASFMSGAAYVPIDPEYPEERIRFIIEDAEVSTILLYVNKELDVMYRQLFEEIGVSVISTRLDELLIREKRDKRFIQNEDREELKRLAYMIYTSGTTGTPKGVEIEQGALSDMIQAHEDFFGSLKDDVVLLFANIVFDASVQQIFPALSQGGTVCIMPENLMDNPLEISDYCNRHGVTFMGMTNALASALDPEMFKGLRILSLGGDSADSKLFAKWALNVKKVINDYGPTEVCVHATSTVYEPEYQDIIPIGRPYNNKKIYIMQGNKLCGIGQKGEICIGGAGVARGYHNRLSVTLQSFIANPFDSGRLYRTGDVGVLRPDGKLLYEGRIDSQIKIRGFRIETGEIESRIRDLDAVCEACVIARVDMEEPYIAAYYTVRSKIDEITIRSHLLNCLPSYMVPQRFMELEELPLNHSGKVDKARLPKPDKRSAVKAEPARNFLEERIINLFKEILKTESVGRTDSFFELGGNSIRLMKLISGLADLKLKAADVFAYPSAAALSGLLLNDMRKEERDRISSLIKDGDSSLPAIFCIPPSGGMSICYMELMRTLDYPGRIYGFTDEKYRLFGKLSFEELKKTELQIKDCWDDTLSSYLKTIEPLFKSGDIMIGYSQGGVIAHTLAGELEKLDKSVGCIIILDGLPSVTDEVKPDLSESRQDRLRAGEAVFFAEDVSADQDDRYSDNISSEDFLRSGLKFHGMEDNETILRSIYETYLVYTVNTIFPLEIKGKIRAKIYSFSLGNTRSGDESPSIKDPWKDYTMSESETHEIEGDESDHFVFLTKYKEELAALLRSILGI